MSFTLAFFTLLPVQAQKCKYITNEKDPITGDLIRKTRQVSTNSLDIHFYRKNDEFKILLGYNVNGKYDIIVSQGSNVFIKLEDGSIIKLESLSDAIPAYNPTMRWTYFELSCNISREGIEMINSGKVNFFRIVESENSNRDFLVEKDKWIKEIASCILSE